MNAIVAEAPLRPRLLQPDAWLSTLLQADHPPLATQRIQPPESHAHETWVEILLNPKLRCGPEADNLELWRTAALAGCEAELDAKVLTETVNWMASHPEVQRVAVNITGPSLIRGFAEQLLLACWQQGVDPRRLCLELCERTPVHASDEPLSELHQLAQAGVSLAIDDFGELHGVTHFGLLTQVPMSLLKVDTSLTRAAAWAAPGQLQPRRVLDGVIRLASQLGMLAVIEGVEGPLERALMPLFHGVAWQGYELGRPVAIT